MTKALGMTTALFAALAVSFSSSSFAARFGNQFIEFELPPQWKCNLEGAEWVCQSEDGKKSREAIIVLAAKIKGDQDTLDQYLSYLNAPKTFKSPQGTSVKSDPKYATTLNINGHPWVDSLHLESEIPGFYTRYLATVKDDIGVLVTYSIANKKEVYGAHQEQLDAMIRTLKVFRKQGGLNAGPAQANLFEQTTIPSSISQGTVFPNTQPVGGSDEIDLDTPKKKDDNTMLLLLVGVAVVGFIWWKRKRPRG